MSGSLFSRLFARATEILDRRFRWHKLPLPLGLLTLVGLRMRLRGRDLHAAPALRPSTRTPRPEVPVAQPPAPARPPNARGAAYETAGAQPLRYVFGITGEGIPTGRWTTPHRAHGRWHLQRFGEPCDG